MRIKRATMLTAAAVAVVLALVAGCSAGGTTSSTSDQPSNGQQVGLPQSVDLAGLRAAAGNSLQGKSAVFIPQGLGIPIMDSISAELKLQLEQMGMTYSVQDPANDPQKQVAVTEAAIAQKPKVLLVFSLDPQLLAKQLREAQQNGIYVVQVQLQSATVTDAYVGADFDREGTTLGTLVAERCAGKSVGLLHALPSASYDITVTAAMKKVLDEKNVKVVSEQTAGMDPTKAAGLANAMMQQTPDLCGIVGTYDSMMIGAGNAVKSSGRPISVWSTGGGDAACTGVRDGTFTAVTQSAGARTGMMAAALTQTLVESNLPPGSSRFAVYTPVITITKANYTQPNLCYAPLT